MKAMLFKANTLFACIAYLALSVSGCSRESGSDSTAVAEATQGDHMAHDHDDDPSHGGWWCVEHGIPEEECSMCSVKAANDFKAKDDWCEDHNRAESQCFICEPSRAEKYARLYEAKIGHKPPELEIAEE